MPWTQFLTTFPLEIIALDGKQFGTGGGMSRTNAYDLVIIGGGIAGSSLACSMAKAGARVLLLESKIEFRDRVRGEILCRGSRTLRDALLSNGDWDVSGRSYACDQNRFYTIIRTVTGWLREFFLVTGPSADARRAHALPLIGQDKTRVPDLVFSGPDSPLAPDARARLFGEDVAPA